MRVRGRLPMVLEQGSAVHRLYVVLPWVLVVVAIAYVPLAADAGFAPGSIDKPFRIGQLNNAIAIAVAILGLTIVTGYGGLVSLGQSAFVGLGAYTSIILVTDHDWSYVATLPVSGALCFVAGLLVGIPVTRMKGMYVAAVTLSLAFVFPTLVAKFDSLTGGVNGKGPRRGEARLLAPDWMPFADDRRLSRPLWVYCISIVTAATVFVMVRNFAKSSPGRALVAVRDDQLSAVTFGIDVARYKAIAFGLSAACGGLAGSLLVMDRPFVTGRVFDTNMALFLFVALVVGGSGAVSGAVAGAFFYVFVQYFASEWVADQDGMPPGVRQVLGPSFERLRTSGGAVSIFFGVALLLVMFVAPGGFVAGVRGLRVRLVTVVPRPPRLRPKHELPEEERREILVWVPPAADTPRNK